MKSSQPRKVAHSQRPSQKQKAAMIATASSTNTAPTPVHWIEGRHGDDAGTVISEITHDPTAFANGEDSLVNILGSWTNQVNGSIVTPDRKKTAPGSPKKGDDGSHTDKPTSIKSASSKSTKAKTTKSTASSSKSSKTQKVGTTKAAPPSAASLANAAAQVAVKKKASIKVAPATTKAAPVPAKNAPPSAASLAKAAAEVVAKKKPYPAMDVSPNPQVKKAKALTSPKLVTKTTASVSTSPKAAMSAKPPPKPAPKSPPRVSVAPPVVKKQSPVSPAARASTPGNAGLSELSKQLRVQRAKNEWQHNEIARLERQLRILSDLKGVSVADLRFSLENACQEEAHGELRNRVASLQAQLEALQMQRTNNRRASTANSEAAESKIATLQLRIGELEEVEQTRQQEVQALYQKLREETARATKAEANNAQQQAQINKFEEVAKMYVKDVEQIQAERDALKQQVAELMDQLANQENQRKLDQAMRAIEEQIEMEQQRKREYLNNARQQAAANRSVAMSVAPSVASHSVLHAASPAASNRLLVGQQAGMPTDASIIATSVRPDDESSEFMSSANSSVVTGPVAEYEDDISHLGDDMSLSVHTMDALMMQGLSEEQAKEALAKDAKISSLYDELREQATKASQMQTLCANQKAQIERFAEQLNEKEGVLRSTQSNYDFAKTEHDSLYKRFCDIELQLTLEQEKVEGLEQQLNARTHESNLRNDQFKCRFQVQNERIADLEQQQSSLYAAFELLQQEVKGIDKEHNKLKSSLDEADSEVARQLRESEKKDRRSSRRRSSGAERASMSASQRHMLDSSMTSISGNDNPFDVRPVATATPISSQVQAFASYNQSTANMFDPVEQTSQEQGIDHPMRTHGYLYKLDKIKGWKKRFFVLYGEGGVYQMTYSDSPKERVKGTINNITIGVSTVAETNKSIKKPFSFVLHVDPLQQNGQVLYAAALTADDFRKWMTALKAATIRPEDSMYMSTPILSAEAQIEADMEVARRMQSVSSRDLGRPSDQDSQIESDHLMAMRMQIQNQPQAFA